MKKVRAGVITVPGLDVSHYDENINFSLVKASGREFVFAKCTEYSPDSLYSKNKINAEAAGLLFGAYHFFHPSKDPNNQAQNFLLHAKLQKGNLPAVLDWESSDNIPSQLDRQRGKIWLDVVEKATGKPPIIYGGPYFLNALSLDTSFKKYPLWVAHYGVSSPLVPNPWLNWTFWQNSSTGSVPGIPAKDEDLDIFNGSLSSLKLLTL